MKKLLLIAFLATPLYADGPQFVKPSDGDTYSEFLNVYKDLKYPKAANFTANNSTSSFVHASTGTFDVLKVNGNAFVSTSWASYTPTIVGAGTVSGVAFSWRQSGDTIFVKGFFTSGVCTAVPTTVTLPNSTAISSTKASANFQLGVASRIVTSGVASTGVPWMVFYDGSDTTHAYITQQTKSNAFLKNNASDIFANGDSCSLFFDYPI